MIGTVTSYNKAMKYGFIKGENGQLYFAHFSCICGEVQELEVGEMVTFEPADGSRGPQANNIEK